MPARPLTTLLFATILSCVSACGINNIPIFEQAVNESWIEVQAQYRRRAELVMDLMQLLEPLRTQEPEIYANLQAVETRVFEMHVTPDTLEDPDAFANFQEQQQALTDILGDVLIKSQDLTDLAEAEDFKAMQSTLAGNAELINVARRDYWQKVQRYNSELVTVPGRWWRAFVYPRAQIKENFVKPAS